MCAPCTVDATKFRAQRHQHPRSNGRFDVHLLNRVRRVLRHGRGVRGFMEKSTVLVVDDDPNTLESVRDILLRSGFAVDTATTGRDALGKLLDEKQPAVIVLDIRMPVMDGRQFLTITRAYHRLASIPVMV